MLIMHLKNSSYVKEKVKKQHKKGTHDTLSLGNRWKVKNPIMDNLKEIKKITSSRHEQDTLRTSKELKIAADDKKMG